MYDCQAYKLQSLYGLKTESGIIPVKHFLCSLGTVSTFNNGAQSQTDSFVIFFNLHIKRFKREGETESNFPFGSFEMKRKIVIEY